MGIAETRRNHRVKAIQLGDIYSDTAAVAVGRVVGVFAGAQPGVRVFLHLEGQRGEASVFMGTVAEGLVS
jgi:hypothetical protein